MGAPDTRVVGEEAAIDLQAASRASWVSSAAAMVGQSCAFSRKLHGFGGLWSGGIRKMAGLARWRGGGAVGWWMVGWWGIFELPTHLLPVT